MDDLLKQINSGKKRRTESSHLQKTLQTQRAEREKCRRMILDLYPDWKNGDISKEEYLLLKQNITERIEALDERSCDICVAVVELSEPAAQFSSEVLRRRVIAEGRGLHPQYHLLDEILVHEGQRITVRFKFEDAYARVLEYIEMNKETIPA